MDWTLNAARVIHLQAPQDTSVPRIVAIIAEHVPKCKECKHWDNIGSENKYLGACRLYEHDPWAPVAFSSMTTRYDFGCVKQEAK